MRARNTQTHLAFKSRRELEEKLTFVAAAAETRLATPCHKDYCRWKDHVQICFQHSFRTCSTAAVTPAATIGTGGVLLPSGADTHADTNSQPSSPGVGRSFEGWWSASEHPEEPGLKAWGSKLLSFFHCVLSDAVSVGKDLARLTAGNDVLLARCFPPPGVG